MITRFEQGLFWVLTPEDVDEQRLRVALSVTDEAAFEIQDEMERLRSKA